MSLISTKILSDEREREWYMKLKNGLLGTWKQSYEIELALCTSEGGKMSVNCAARIIQWKNVLASLWLARFGRWSMGERTVVTGDVEIM
jgi:hypothetical protein